MATPEVETTEGGAAQAGGVRAADYNPFSPEVRHDPYPYYKVLRRERPVAQAMGLPIYTVTRYDDVLHILQNPEIFSSSRRIRNQMPPMLTLFDARSGKALISKHPLSASVRRFHAATVVETTAIRDEGLTDVLKAFTDKVERRVLLVF